MITDVMSKSNTYERASIQRTSKDREDTSAPVGINSAYKAWSDMESHSSRRTCKGRLIVCMSGQFGRTHLLYPVNMYSLSLHQSGNSAHVSVGLVCDRDVVGHPATAARSSGTTSWIGVMFYGVIYLTGDKAKSR